MNYEVVHEIKNSCPNNQMRDVFIDEIETDDPVAWVRSVLKGEMEELICEERRGGVTVHAVCNGLRHQFTFTE